MATFVVEMFRMRRLNFFTSPRSSSLQSPDQACVPHYAPQPRAVLRVVNPDDPLQTVAHGEVGRVELTTLTQELFMPRFLERDEGIRREPCREYPWDGVGEVRPFGAQAGNIVEGVY